LTGSPTSGFQIVIKISFGGLVGNATFDWSSDGGVTYTTNVPTDSSVALGTTGVTAQFSAGTYSTSHSYTAIVNGVALSVKNNNTILQGFGRPPTGGSAIIVNGLGTGLVIEGATGYPVGNGGIAQASQIQNLSFRGGPQQGGPQRPYDMIVVHTNNASITDCLVFNCKRHGILVESGTSGSIAGGLLGVTQAPSGIYFNSDFWRITNSSFLLCGNWANGTGKPTEGAAVYIHGSDSNAGTASGLTVTDCNISYYAGGLGGSTWIECYSHSSRIGYYMASAFPSTFVGCGSEDITRVYAEPNNHSLGIGGSLAPLCPQNVGEQSNLVFSNLSRDRDKATYGARVPGAAYNALIATSRASTTPVVATGTTPPNVTLTGVPVTEYNFVIAITTAGTVGGPPGTQKPVFKWSADGGTIYYTGVTAEASVPLKATGIDTHITANFPAGTYSIDNVYKSNAHVSLWNLEYEPGVTPGLIPYPYLERSYRLINRISNSVHKDPYGGTFGFTDIDSPRGENLPFIANPLLNTRRRWTYKQPGVGLAAGTNTRYIRGDATTRIVFLDDPKSLWPKVQTRLSVELEWDTVAHMQAAGDVHICGYSIIDVDVSKGYRNAAVQIQAPNSVLQSGGLTVVWHIEMFVTNSDSGVG
jgi:hypothetical protein